MSLYNRSTRLILMSLVVIAMAVIFQRGREQVNADPLINADSSDTSLHTHRLLNFTDRDDGSVDVIDVHNNVTIARIAAGEGSFMRGVLRTLTSERRQHGQGASEPFELRSESSKRLLLIDQATGRTILLNAFGPKNAAFFKRFLVSPTLS